MLAGMIRKSLVSCLVLVLIGVLAGGCTMDRVERHVCGYEGIGRAPLMPAPFKGRYTLYQNRADHAETAVLSLQLAPPAQVGFRRDDTSELVVAVAGERTIDLPQGRHIWKATPDAGQYDKDRTGDTALTAGLLVVGVIVLIAAAAFSF